MTRTAVITGASQGLGLAMARKLAREGYSVVLAARTRSKLDAAVKTITDFGGTALAIPTDISDPDQVQTLAREVKASFGTIDLLVNNAGIFTTECLENIGITAIKRDLDVSLLGTILVTREFIPLLKRESRILFISSGFGLMGAAGYSVYCAAKAGVVNFADAIRRELKAREIRVYVSVPADIDTPAFRDEVKNAPDWMTMAGARPTPISADAAAARILGKCRGSRFLIFSDMGVRMLVLLQKLTPKWLSTVILDGMFPRPPANTPK